MNVKWYYRQSEVPDSVYQHLVQDRNNENGEWLCPIYVVCVVECVCVWEGRGGSGDRPKTQVCAKRECYHVF